MTIKTRKHEYARCFVLIKECVNMVKMIKSFMSLYSSKHIVVSVHKDFVLEIVETCSSRRSL